MQTSLALVAPRQTAEGRPHHSINDRLGLAPIAAHQDSSDSYRNLVTRLSRASVKKHFDAYADVAWDAPEFEIDPHDPRWILSEEDPIGATAWYIAQPERDRARIGLATAAFQMKMGIAFEGILQRGLLELASTLPNGSPEFRYAMHEVIEEGQHSLMFQEFVNRSGFDAPGMGPLMAFTARRVPALGRRFPELFFLHVLGGETPIDNVQRQELCRGASVHPLKRRIMQIHVTEEARHVCFAENYLENHVPQLGRARLLELRAITPFVLRETAALILRPPRRFFEKTGIPKKVATEAYEGAAYRSLTLEGLEPIRELCVKLGIVTPALVPLWRALGIWPTLPRKKALTA
jgi:hypothetical protein